MLSLDVRLWSNAFKQHGWQVIGVYGIGEIGARSYWFTILDPHGRRYTVTAGNHSASIAQRLLDPNSIDSEGKDFSYRNRYSLKRDNLSIDKTVAKLVSGIRKKLKQE